ncbi:MAG: hypothetical protein LBM78_01735, partial [Clostridiales bacterium]|nr:hypothetical protein [Clostridiales bacterium]
MTNSVYKRYRDRLVEITGRSRSLWAKSLTKRQSYPLGRLFEGDAAAAKDFISFLWGDTGRLYRLLTPEQTARAYAAALGAEAAKTVPKAFAEGELSNLRALKREAEELELETGRYELYVGYPFVEGTIDADIPVKAPLLLFPARLHLDGKTELEILRDEPVLLNKVFLLAYARAYRLNFEDVESEFETLKNKFSDVDAVVKFLAGIGVEVKAAGGKRVIADFEKSAPPVKGLEVRNYCVLGRFPLANSIYYDYNALVKKKLTSPALDVLLNNKDARLPKKGKRDESPYFIARMDYAQEQAARRAEGEGDTVIYGPPGTGKSQTLMNILAGSLCRGKRVLVVAQKRAALDVIYSRMGALAEKMVLMPDPEKARNAFYAKTRVRHSELAGYTPKFDAEAYAAVSRELEKEIGNLTALEAALFTRTAFGLTLQEMYALSADAGRSPQDEKTYAALKACEPIKWDYPRFSAAVKSIEERNKAKLYFDFMKASAADPLIEYIKTDLDMHTINKVRAFLKQLAAGERAPFDIAAYPYSRYILAHNLETDGNGDYETLVDMVARQKPHTHTRREIREKLTAASSAIRRFVGEFDLLGAVLEPKGLAMAVDYIAYGNTKFIKKLASSLEDYLAVRDMNLCVRDMSADEKKLLGFALARTQSRAEFTAALKKLLPLRIYHEALSEEKRHEGTLSKTIIFDDLRKRILTLQAQQKKLAGLLAADKLNAEYGQLLAKDAQRGRNFLHQIGKQDKLWPVRRLMEHFEDLLLTMFPCWLLTPEAASAILPLENDMFDLLLFDEASQVFIESAVPAIYRAKRLVVAGDNKQLRPTSVFLKRYTGGDTSGTDDLNTQAVLEVESLLDLAASRLKPAHLTYHYRSKYEELINFSNYAFYEGRLLVAPNVARGRGAPPIERIMVPG